MKNKIIYFVLFAISFGLLSCDKELDLKPYDEVDGSKAFATIEGLEKGVYGVYAAIGMNNFIGVSDKASDDLRLSDQNTGQGVQMHNWVYTSSTNELDALMTSFYSAIDRANRILGYAANFDENDNKVKQLKAELYFIRAFCHYELAVLFCKPYEPTDPKGMPYMLKSEISSPARLSQGEYFSLINADLTDAKSLMPADFFEIGRTNLTAIKALQARVALHMNDWVKAEEYATDVIDNGGFSLATFTQYPNVWDDANGNDVEVIFKLKRVTGDGLLGDEYRRASNNDIFFHPSNAIQALYDANDLRGNLFFGLAGSNPIVIKHNGRPAQTVNLVDIKVLRISEMYLIRAEARAMQTGKLDLATDDINSLLAERITGFIPYEDFSSTQNAMNEIILQRRLELAYEGFRFYDLKRWGLSINRLDSDVLLASGKDLEAGDYRFVFPIPQQEIFANPNMVQNDGYTN